MPISYSCPHCGKQSSVAEQYAGQTGPCAACGKPITIPGAPLKMNYAPAAAAAGGGLAVVAIVLVVVLVLCGGVGLALLLPAVQAAREAARRSQSSNNLKQIGLALHMYHDQYKTFPPAVVTDANGKPLYSGRVLLLPYLEQQNLYEAFNKDEPWNSDNNLPLTQTPIKTFMDPSSTDNKPGKTDYLFVTGQGTIFEAGQYTSMGAITDGTSNTMVLVEVKSAGINWAEPRDHDMSAATPLPPGNHPGGNIVVLADGSVRFISKNINPQMLRQLSTKNGGEPVGGF
jgi:type II secretory pathway pseudopilin PulG